MERLLHYCADISLNLRKTCGTKARNFFISGEMHYETQFIGIMPSDEIQNDCLTVDTTIYTLTVVVMSHRAKYEHELAWQYTPKPIEFHIGFIDSNYDRLLETALQWMEDHKDPHMKPIEFTYGSFKPTLQPIKISHKQHRHYSEDL